LKKIYLLSLFFMMIFSAKILCAEPVKDLSKVFAIVSIPFSAPDNKDKHFADITFRVGWNDKAPYAVAVQFVNHGYDGQKFKFAIKDLTSKKMLVLDPAHKSRFGTENLRANSESSIWSGAVDNYKDSFSLRIWDSQGDEFDSDSISVDKDQK
jgi:hypothetical protein